MFLRWTIVLCAIATVVGCGGGKVDQAIADLNSPDPKIRVQGAQTLFELQRRTPKVVAALSTAATDPHPEVRRWSCRTLGELGEIAAPTQPILETALQDQETAVRRAAAFALQKLVPDSAAYRAELTEAMLAGDGGVIVALPKLDPTPTWALPTLLEILKDRRPGTRRIAIDVLAEIGGTSADVKIALERAAATDKDDRVRESATAALTKLSAGGLQSSGPNGKL